MLEPSNSKNALHPRESVTPTRPRPIALQLHDPDPGSSG